MRGRDMGYPYPTVEEVIILVTLLDLLAQAQDLLDKGLHDAVVFSDGCDCVEEAGVLIDTSYNRKGLEIKEVTLTRKDSHNYPEGRKA